jgi:hypothetical protein
LSNILSTSASFDASNMALLMSCIFMLSPASSTR